jgi:hypothetical protein
MILPEQERSGVQIRCVWPPAVASQQTLSSQSREPLQTTPGPAVQFASSVH